MLAHSAWDFYFNRAEREILIDRFRTPGTGSAEEVCLRARDGEPIWVMARRTVASYVDGVPELLQSTFIDITAQKKAQARLRGIIGGLSSGATPEGKSAGITDLSHRIGNILRHFIAKHFGADLHGTRLPDPPAQRHLRDA